MTSTISDRRGAGAGRLLVLTKLLVMATLFVLGTGFAPFNSGGLMTFTVESGQGDPNDPRESSEPVTIEAQAVFHTLSSRYGGGGVAVFVEFLPGNHGFSGLAVFDLRHAGLYDLWDPQVLEMPDRRRAELYYQEWDKGGDRFMSETVRGTVTIDELFRGEGVSAMAFTFDVTFLDLGDDGHLDSTDAWRRVQGSATTWPTVEGALRRESLEVYGDASERDPYAPDGNIYVNCFGEVEVEEEGYEEDSYAYDDESDSCQGDTWEDDTTTPEDEAGCAAKEPVDDGEPDPETSCDDSGDDLSDPSSDDDLYYDEDDSSDDDSSCDGDTDDSVAMLLPAIADVCLAPAVADAAQPGGHALRAMRRTLARIGRGERLDVAAITAPAPRPRATVFGKESWRTVRRILAWLPFFLLGLGIHVARRRMRRA